MNRIENGERYGAKDVLVKQVSVWSVVGIIYCICCAGAFGIEEMIPVGGPGLTLIVLIALPFLWALPYSYLVAELGSARPVEGGKLMWVKEALGEYWFGIMVVVNFIWGLIANTVYVVLSVEYLGSRIPAIAEGMPAYILKVGLILIFFVINLMGIKEVSWVSTIISAAVAGLFLLITVVGFANASQSPFEPMVNTTEVSDFGFGSPVLAFGAVLGLGIWMYCGYDEISLIGGEVKGSQKVIPKAIMIAIPLIALTYILPTMAGMASIGDTWEDWSTAPDGVGYHSVLEQVGGSAGLAM
jgi:amino acid transporter